MKTFLSFFPLHTTNVPFFSFLELFIYKNIMGTKKITINELRSIVKNIIKEESEKLIQKIKINTGEVLSVYLINKPFDSYLYVIDSDGELYIDISTKLIDNPLDNAIWVKIGGNEEKIANNLKILERTDVTTKSGYNSYIKYNIK